MHQVLEYRVWYSLEFGLNRFTSVFPPVEPLRQRDSLLPRFHKQPTLHLEVPHHEEDS